MFYKRINNSFIFKFLPVYSLLISTYTVISNIVILNKDNLASKIITGSSGEMAITYSQNTNLGDFSLPQTIVVFVVVLVGIFICTQKSYIKFIVSVLIII